MFRNRIKLGNIFFTEAHKNRLGIGSLLRLTFLAWWHVCAPCMEKIVVDSGMYCPFFAAVRGIQFSM